MLDYLFIRPCFDEATQYSYKWCGRLIQEVKDKVTFVDLDKERAVRSEVELTIALQEPKVIIHYDHGNEGEWVGQDEKAVLDTKNVELLRDRIAYSMNCLSAKKLGVDAWKNGCKAYVGYIQVFGFTIYDEEIFCEGANYGLILYTDGETNWETIKRKIFEKFSQLIDKATDPWTKLWLRHDRDSLRVWNGEEPTSDCPFRQIALKLFGTKAGWNLWKSLRNTLKL